MTKPLDPAVKARRAAEREAKWAAARLVPKPGKDFRAPVVAELPPENLAAMLDADSDALSTVKRVAQSAGLPVAVTKELLKRVRAQYAPLLGELRDVKTSELIRLVEDRAWMAVEMIDRESLAELNAYQRAIIFGVLVDKSRVLKGLPTHIVSVEDRRQLDQVAGMLIKEMERRGMVVDDRGEMVDVTPGTTDEFRPRHQRRPGWKELDALALAEENEASGEAEARREGAP